MPGLYLSTAPAEEARLAALLHDFDLPLAGFTPEPSAISPDLPRAAFLRTASVAALLGQPLPARPLSALLRRDDPLPANVLRRHVLRRLSLLPYLRTAHAALQAEGFWLVGDALLLAPVSTDDTVDIPLPSGTWTELNGTTHTGRLRCMRGYNETPLLVRENALLPVSMNGASLAQSSENDADRLTLHWFQPGSEASCSLADGTQYHVQRTSGQICLHADRPCHLILHEDGRETLLQ